MDNWAKRFYNSLPPKEEDKRRLDGIPDGTPNNKGGNKCMRMKQRIRNVRKVIRQNSGKGNLPLKPTGSVFNSPLCPIFVC